MNAYHIETAIAEKRMTFHRLSWQAYKQIANAITESSSARLTYDNGTLEIVMPLELHEFSGVLFGVFVRVLVSELGLPIKSMGSTTLDREDLLKGVEPDQAFYIQNQPLVKGRDINIYKDPAPDLVIEVDITHTDIKKVALYASLGVPEFWRYNGQLWKIYQLQNAGQYQEVEVSPTFPTVPKERLYQFLSEAREDEIGAEVNLRKWIREL
jgi:Uma2 family endonuclease